MDSLHNGKVTGLGFIYQYRMRALIDGSVERSLSHSKDELYDEVLQQWDLARTRCQDFLGREDILEVSHTGLGPVSRQHQLADTMENFK